jgi:hypothetical protein
MTISIVGAGLAGLLAANMLHRRNPKVFETQDRAPNNHSAVLRFRSSVVGDTLGIPFRRVTMVKCPIPWLNPVADALAYSRKCSGEYRSDRSITSGLVTQDRFIAPDDLIARMLQGVDATYSVDFLPGFMDWGEDCPPVISTIPMPALMERLDYPYRPVFRYSSGINVKADVASADAFCSVLIPNPEECISRVSLTGSEIIAEIPNMEEAEIDAEFVMRRAATFLGIEPRSITGVRAYRQTYQKIIPIDDEERKRFIAWATDKHNVYSLGRYATWRPTLLLDDLVRDIRHIESWITGAGYEVRQHRSSAK